MIKIESTEKKPIKMWLEDLEPNALAQARNLANLPFTFKHVAIMSDAHCGYGMPIAGYWQPGGQLSLMRLESIKKEQPEPVQENAASFPGRRDL
jgi:hypothetical protein